MTVRSHHGQRQQPDASAIRPLFGAGFVTAFGAHSIAATLGTASSDLVTHLLALGVLLALYDGAEVLLKPVFGSLADRIGPRPVLLGDCSASLPRRPPSYSSVAPLRWGRPASPRGPPRQRSPPPPAP